METSSPEKSRDFSTFAHAFVRVYRHIAISRKYESLTPDEAAFLDEIVQNLNEEFRRLFREGNKEMLTSMGSIQDMSDAEKFIWQRVIDSVKNNPPKNFSPETVQTLVSQIEKVSNYILFD